MSIDCISNLKTSTKWGIATGFMIVATIVITNIIQKQVSGSTLGTPNVKPVPAAQAFGWTGLVFACIFGYQTVKNRISEKQKEDAEAAMAALNARHRAAMAALNARQRAAESGEVKPFSGTSHRLGGEQPSESQA